MQFYCKSIMPHCATFNCSNDQQANVSLFRFPINDKKLLSLWLAALKTCRRPPTEYILITGKEHSRLCSNHFSQESFTQNIEVLKSIDWSLKRVTLKPDALPSVFDFQVRSHKVKSEAAKRTDPDGHLSGARGRLSESTEKKMFSICKATEERGELYLVTSVLKTKQNLNYLITIHRLRSNLELF